MSTSPPPEDLTSERRRRAGLRVAAMLTAMALALLGWASTAPSASADTAFTFTGSGWGHGVGMSQWGARGMAAGGADAGQILTHYYTGTSLTTVGSPDVRVLLATAPSITFSPGSAVAFPGVGTATGAVTATAPGGSIVLSGALAGDVGSAVFVQSSGAPMRVSPPGNRLSRGTIVLRATGAGTVQAVLHIPMQEYLYGLGEMPSSWPAAAMQAQAIAARTFAQKKVATANGGGTYDIVGGLPDQSYIGYEKEGAAMGAQWVAAVDATDTMVVTYNGALIDAVYSASSGGYTENSEFVWVSAVPYLRGVPDAADLLGGNPNASWTRTYSGTQLGAWFGVGQVTSVQVLGPLGVSGRVDKATIRLVGTGATKDVSGTSFRATVNANAPGAQLMSTRFTVDGQAPVAPPGNAPPPGNAQPPAGILPSGDIALARAEGSTIAVLGHATDPDGDPRVRIVSRMGSQVATRELVATGGVWGTSWTGSRGTRSICVTLLDNPTGQGVDLGCRSVTVK